MSVKKQSLFKQKLKQAKKIEDEKETEREAAIEVESFPKVFKIDRFNIDQDFQTRKNSKTNTQQQMIDETDSTQNIQESKSYLESHQSQLTGILSEDQLNQINNENWNAVSSMNQEERENYINLIENTLPLHFINKLKKKKALQTHSSQNQKIQQMIPEMEKISLNPSPSFITPTKTPLQTENTMSKEQDAHYDDENQKNIMDQIYLNIKTGKLMYLSENVLVTFSEDQKTEMLNKSKIFEMLTAQNNQSQIVGSQLVLIWLKNTFSSQNLVFYVNDIPFHSRIMTSEMYELLKVIQSNLRSTKFYSCYIEMLVKSVEILTIFYKKLSNTELKQQLLFIQNQFEKTQKSLKELLNSKTHSQDSQNNQLQQKQMLFQSLGILYQSLKQQVQKRDENSQLQLEQISIEQKFEKMKSFHQINQLIEVILIEQTLQKQEFQKYEIQPSINSILQTLSAFWDCKVGSNFQNFYRRLLEVNEFFTVFYQLILKFAKKQKNFPFYKNLVKKIFIGILEVTEDTFIKKTVETLISKTNLQQKNFKDKNSQKQLMNAIFFKALFIYRQLACDTEKFAIYLQKQKDKWSFTEDQASILVYLNFNHYVSVSDLKNEEITMLETMFEWLRKEMQKRNVKNEMTFLDSDEVLTNLLKLFLSSQQEVYSLLDQNLLQQAFKEAISFYELNPEKIHPILSENEIKKMVQNYNFNSFGNDIFTKVMFWVAVTISPEIEALIGQEVMMRYPMLFYYACQSTKLTERVQNEMMQENLIENPLLGDISNYIRVKGVVNYLHFTISSNDSTKQNLLKLLSLNLDFENCGIFNSQSVKKIFNKQEKEQTEGFIISKSKANEQNYFIKYLIQPFLKQIP